MKETDSMVCLRVGTVEGEVAVGKAKKAGLRRDDGQQKRRVSE